MENGADVNARDCVSFNFNEKDETDVSVYKVKSGNTAAYVFIACFLVMSGFCFFLPTSFRTEAPLYICQLSLFMKGRTRWLFLLNMVPI